MAHEGMTVFMILAGILLLVGYYLGPAKEVREIKRFEGKVMMVPSAIILFVLAIITFSGLLG